MSALRIPAWRVPLPPRLALLAVLALAYALVGLVGHDPWKSEDAIGTGIVHQMLAHGEWLVPNLAGETFVEDGPLYFWAASALAWLTTPLLAPHDGARLASGGFILLAVFLIRRTARELYGPVEGDGAALVLLGSLGLLLHAHETLAENGMLAAQAAGLYAIVLARRRPLGAGMLLALAWAGALLCKGLAAALVPALAALAAPLACRDWRSRRYASTLLIAAALGAGLSGTWLGAAQLRVPAAALAWFSYQAHSLSIPTTMAIADYAVALSWAAWPAWPIAAWIAWAWRYRVGEAGVAFPLAVLAIACAMVALMPEYREINTLPVLLPLALLAGAGAPILRRGAAAALAWFGAMTFSFFGALVWLGWFAMMTGVPAQIHRNFAKLEPGHVPQFQWPGFALACVYTLMWLVILLRSVRSPLRGVAFWAAGVTLLWGLVMTLWLDWIDYGKTYRPVAQSVARALPQAARCVESRNLGEAQRAVFDYHAEIVTRRAEARAGEADPSRCPALLVLARPDDDERALGPGWTRIWEGNRPRDKERYRLYVRAR